jgi:diguanylate cyclase (GGDEF)-like protein
MCSKRSFLNISLNRKVWVSVSLVSLIPILVFFYYFQQSHISFWSLFILPIIVFLGWGVIFKILLGIKTLSSRSRKALESIGEKAPGAIDEMQSLESSINLLTSKVKTGFGQLQGFTQKIEELNQKVSRKVLTLSTVLQANDLFSKETPADEVVKFLSYHLQQLLEGDICFCALKDDSKSELRLLVCSGLNASFMAAIVEKKGQSFLRIKKNLIVDSVNKGEGFEDIASALHMKNFTIAPIIMKGSTIGILGVANNKDGFSFSKDDIDTLSLFAQNITLIWDRERLSSRVKTLEVIDNLTGLYNERMLIIRLDEEIKRASVYQRPCGFISVELIGYEEAQAKIGIIETEKLIKKAAVVFKGTLNAVDIAGRLGPAQLAAILIERNKRQSKNIIKDLNSKLKFICQDKVNLSFSVAESPVDGMSAQELIDFANSNKVSVDEV